MASKVKEIHQYDGTQWGQAVPIGADASNVDVKTSDNTDISLQSVLGSFNATEPSIKTQINSKVDKEGGDVAHAVINDPVNQIPIYDLDTEETSEKLISDDISTDTDMVVMSGDGENLTTMWGKFNRFRKRVDNKFKNYLVTSLEGVAPGASSDTKGYSTQALNNYFNDVIGYTSAASVSQVGSVASQLSSLNSKIVVDWENNSDQIITIANSKVITWKSGSAKMMHVANSNLTPYIIFFTVGFETRQVRTDLPCFGFKNPRTSAQLRISRPYIVPCGINNVVQFSQYTNDGLWFPVPGTWNTNTRATFTGIVTCSN